MTYRSTNTTVRRPRRSPTKKYLDGDRVQVNPAWLEEREEARALAAQMDDAFLDTAGQRGMYFPEAEDKQIPEEGAWILVLDEPLTELRSRFRVPLLSMWRARPHELNSGAYTARTELGPVKVFPKQAVIQTPGGDLHLWAHEYLVAQDPRSLVADPDAILHTLGGEPVLDEEQVFYLLSRGIPHQQAVLMLFDQIQNSDFVYVTFPEEITELLRGVGTPLWQHVEGHPRMIEEGGGA